MTNKWKDIESVAITLSTNVAATPLCVCSHPFSDKKLDGTKYTLWKFKILTILDFYELLETIMGIVTFDPTHPSTLNVDLLRA